MHIDVDHGCGRTHHSWSSLAGCCWPDAGYITGDGPHAVVARCGMVAVSLHTTAADAGRRVRRLDTVGCGRGCQGRHHVAVLAQPSAARAR